MLVKFELLIVYNVNILNFIWLTLIPQHYNLTLFISS